MRTVNSVLMTGVGLMLAPQIAMAVTPDWQVELSSYGWFPETTSHIKTPSGKVRSELGASDALNALDAAFMGSISAHNGQWSVVGDIFYLDLSFQEQSPFGRLFWEVETKTTLKSIGGYGLYNVFQNSWFALDAGMGARFLSGDIDVALRGISRPDVESSVSDAWIDPLVAVRATAHLGNSWRLVLWMDGGGFGVGEASDRTWQVTSAVTYRLSQKWSLSGGYRYLYLDRQTDGVPYDLRFSGPLFGLGYRF
ncbi:porin family protein [Pseudomonas siliginis]|uniref:porin family protein n=1 Tax=Pseudomonas siliginis TaxID=2842346 RepID=UPI002092F016|nr:porin family protein [Pseudomonas siliginis]UST72293.1 porin family protein [Pseudomonas siliginis]